MASREGGTDAKRSDWNPASDRILSEPNLTVAEFRVALAVLRCSAGYNSPVASVGKKRLVDVAGPGVDKRTLKKALASLEARGMLSVTPGSPGAGNRGTYQLLHGRASLEAPVSAARITKATKPSRANRKDQPNTAVPASLQTQAIDAFRSRGGDLEYGKNRPALVRGVKTLSKKGVADEEIIAAAAALGREGEFTGYLAAKVEELREQGGPCKWARMRSGLDPRYLRECGCAGCIEWAEVLEQGGVAA